MMNKINNIMKKIIILSIMIAFLGVQYNSVYAMNYSNGEFKTKPSSSGGSSSNQQPSTPTPTPSDDTSSSSDITVYDNYVAGIGGNVTEIIESINEQELGNNGNDSSGIWTNQGVEGIYVEASNGSCTTTDAKGEYYLPLNPGESISQITFKYGYLSNKEINNATVKDCERIQKILKYNGQDYAVADANGYINTIELSGKGCAQVYLVLDCSVSMNDKIELSNGKTAKKIDVEKEIATNIVDSLLDGSKNIYVGLVVFTGEYYRRLSLTNDRNLLNKAINEEIEFNDYYYTNIKGALEKAYDSYANNIEDTSNRYMFLLSDGLPTADGDESHTLYSNASKAENDKNLKEIAKNTKEEIKTILDNGVKLYSVLTLADSDESDKQLIENTFNCFQKYSDSYTYKSVTNIEDVLKEIVSEFEDFVKDSVKISESSYKVNKDGLRAEVLGNYEEGFDYGNTNYFEALDMEVTEDNLNLFKLYLKDLVKYTTVTVNCDTSVTGETPSTESYVTEDIKNEEGEVIGTRTIHHVPNPITVSGPTLTLQQLPQFTLDPTITVTGLAVVANNGATIDSKSTNIVEQEHLISTVEPKLLQGSDVFLQYTINIVNNSVYNDTENIEVLCYIPSKFKYTNSVAIGIGENNQTYSLDMDKVDVITTDNVDEYSNLQKTVTDHIKDGYTALRLSLDLQGFKLLTNGSIQIKVTVKKGLSSKEDDMAYSAETEILSYKNDSCRRIQYKATANKNLGTNKVGLIGATAGNFNKNEGDYDLTDNLGVILIPTGEDKRMYYIYVIIACLTAIGIIIKCKMKRK